MPGIKLPCGTILPVLHGAMPRQPSGLVLFGSMVFQGKNKEDLPFDVHRNVPPALFETLNGFWRNSQDLCHLVLRFPQMPPNFCELFLLHSGAPPLLSYRTTMRDTRDPHFNSELHITYTIRRSARWRISGTPRSRSCCAMESAGPPDSRTPTETDASTNPRFRCILRLKLRRRRRRRHNAFLSAAEKGHARRVTAVDLQASPRIKPLMF